MSNKKKDAAKSTFDAKDYAAIEAMESFNTFVKKKNTFLFSMTGAFLLFYILLPILAFKPVLQQKVIGNITGVWIYSAALFIMTVVVCTIYVKKATKFDEQAANVIKEYQAKGGKS
ncbi:hypothetical protein GCM10007425_08440 [Lysinibacillus alkalisoli]|uniref:DUF485 domain-containing protein n=1 Tax=Lysinibacillus alkalisoli TaxID=1911548 RepID=A0A917LEV5_9BACI|nr:DUF485 domain-containing protein [Lysinibacillus alkalisoli]GGG16407.1 hypothetical protein GCM10007425_08440 [Lysinibacillus alkalisoli]